MDYRIKDQISASIVNEFNIQRHTVELNRILAQNESLLKAVEQIDKVREFVGKPENIIGSQLTKHGEIAEHVEVGVRNARQALNSEKMTSTFEGVGRTAPEDYLIDGIAVQSKFINGINNNLDHVLEHMKQYPYFGKESSFYHIPKDYHEVINRITNGKQVDTLSNKTLNIIKTKIEEIEKQSGKSFNDVVKPGVSKYAEVQQGKVHKTLNQHEDSLKNDNESKINKIHSDHKPSFQEGVKVTGVAIVVGGTVSFISTLYKKHHEGKRFYKDEFTKEDWKEAGIDTVKGAAIGGISGASIYILTNYVALSAPFAGAMVSASKGIGSLVKSYRSGEINQEEFIELGMIVCAESAIVGLATAAGQTLIPIPILGAVIGSIAGSMLVGFIKASDFQTASAITLEINNYLDKLDMLSRDLVNNIVQEFNHLGELTNAAFDLKNNTNLLELSVKLAIRYDVAEKDIIKSRKELDGYMLES